MKRLNRSGITLLETMVVIGVMLLMAALLIPAVQSAREAAHDVRCLSRLRQLVSATSQYEVVHGMYPSTIKSVRGRFGDNLFSVHSALLPYLDEHALYDSLNFSRPLRQPYASSDVDWIEQSTAARSRVSSFLCPADGGMAAFPSAVNYRANCGVGPSMSRSAEFPDSNNGAFGWGRNRTKNSSIFDGLSRTAAFSERLMGTGRILNTRDRRDIHAAPIDYWPELRSADRFAALCAGLDAKADAAGGYEYAGKYWLFSGLTYTLYNHVLPPNSSVMDCQAFVIIPAQGSAAARSNHQGHVNVAFLDGSARAISNSVSLAIWRAIGTRDMAESLPAP